ncbi:uncharacterized protein EDB91DRAFT_42704 [Suillus paluster]|uniref:uncharacterized protein n=1 Tax=Suillus paluster TaxID=48578 RepID=UPI001B8789F4|nr:uncharacterized protein EDB91DRAFT_42704 [Suillus paluster]KAG1747731.1 hypothetical protein EDB91DRAFT_42704 [Suillus paluster]
MMDNIKNLHGRLVEKKDRIIQSIDLHEGFISALWRLPTEVLSQIFDHCPPEFSELSRPSKLEALMLLTRICRRWREIVVAFRYDS